MSNKFSVGDIVKIKNSFEAGQYTYLSGQTLHIKRVNSSYYYFVDKVKYYHNDEHEVYRSSTMMVKHIDEHAERVSYADWFSEQGFSNASLTISAEGDKYAHLTTLMGGVDVLNLVCKYLSYEVETMMTRHAVTDVYLLKKKGK